MAGATEEELTGAEDSLRNGHRPLPRDLARFDLGDDSGMFKMLFTAMTASFSAVTVSGAVPPACVAGRARASPRRRKTRAISRARWRR